MKHRQKDILNKLIPADDLHWDEAEQKYIALSQDEVADIINATLENGFEEEEDIIKVLNWATGVKVGDILLKNLLNGQLSISDFDDDGEPLFSENINGNQ
jgi:hypothetical protein